MSPAIRTAERDHSLGSVRSSLKPTRPSEMPETREQAARRKAPWRTGTRAWPAWATGPQNPDSAASRRPHSAPVRHLHNRLLQMASLPSWTSTRHRAKDTHIDTDARRTCRRPTGSALRRPRETAHTWPLDCVAWSRSAGGMGRRAPLTTSQSVADSSFRRLGDIRALPQSPRSPRSVFANRSGVLATSGQPDSGGHEHAGPIARLLSVAQRPLLQLNPCQSR